MLHQETLHQEKPGRKGNRPRVTAVNDPLLIDYRLNISKYSFVKPKQNNLVHYHIPWSAKGQCVSHGKSKL